MPIRTKLINDCGVAKIDGRFTIYDVAEARTPLIELLSNCSLLGLNLADVTEFDSSALQLLMLLKNESREAGIELQLRQVSGAAQAVLDLFRVSDQFSPESPEVAS